MHLIFLIVLLFNTIYLPINFIEPSLIGKIRAAEGQRRTEIIYSRELSNVAEAHACDMRDRNYFDHVNPEDEGPNYRARNAGVKITSWYSEQKDANQIESIGVGNSEDKAFQSWLDSPAHRLHILGEHEFYAAQNIVGSGNCGNYYVFLSYQKE